MKKYHRKTIIVISISLLIGCSNSSNNDNSLQNQEAKLKALELSNINKRPAIVNDTLTLDNLYSYKYDDINRILLSSEYDDRYYYRELLVDDYPRSLKLIEDFYYYNTDEENMLFPLAEMVILRFGKNGLSVLSRALIELPNSNVIDLLAGSVVVDEATSNVLVKHINHESIGHRVISILTRSRSHNKEAIDALLTISQDKFNKWQQESIYALAKIAPNRADVDMFFQSISNDRSLKNYSARYFARSNIKTDSLRSILFKLNNDENQGVRIWTQCALFNHGYVDSNYLDNFKKSIMQRNDPIETEMWALQAICNKYEHTREIVLHTINSPNEISRLMALHVLRSYNKCDIDLITAIFKRLTVEKSESVAFSIIRTLSNNIELYQDNDNIMDMLIESSNKNSTEYCVYILLLIEKMINMNIIKLQALQQKLSNRKSIAITYILNRIKSKNRLN